MRKMRTHRWTREWCWCPGSWGIITPKAALIVTKAPEEALLSRFLSRTHAGGGLPCGLGDKSDTRGEEGGLIGTVPGVLSGLGWELMGLSHTQIKGNTPQWGHGAPSGVREPHMGRPQQCHLQAAWHTASIRDPKTKQLQVKLPGQELVLSSSKAFNLDSSAKHSASYINKMLNCYSYKCTVLIYMCLTQSVICIRLPDPGVVLLSG